jgi:hypothetical protein
MISNTHGRMGSLPALTFFVVVFLSPSFATAVPSSDEANRLEVALDLRVSGGSPHRVPPADWDAPAEQRGEAARDRWSNRSVTVHGRGAGLGHSIDLLQVGRGWKVGIVRTRLRSNGFTLPDGEVPDFMRTGVRHAPRASALVVAATDEARLGAPGKPQAPSKPMPEPGGALLFAAGLGIAATWSRSRRDR